MVTSDSLPGDTVASSHAQRNVVWKTGKCYKLMKTVVSAKAATTVGGINMGDCSKAYHCTQCTDKHVCAG